jgi:glycosyltransferase involved in cell wall biosynthesis
MKLSESADRLIAFRPPAYVIEHPHKVLWFIHHIRTFYDLWDTPYRGMPDDVEHRAIRDNLRALDTRAIAESRAVFTNSQVVADRLKTFNGLSATPLYPPVYQPERFTHTGYGDEIVAISRLEPHKRQALMIEAMQHVKTGVKLRLAGTASSAEYGRQLVQMTKDLGVQDRVILEDRWISEDEKAEMLKAALAVAYLPKDEDSYGYPSLEGAHAKKAIITTTDSGGVLELVEHGRNGLISEPDPRALAEQFDRLHADKQGVAKMGTATLNRLAEMKIDWSTVVERLTA